VPAIDKERSTHLLSDCLHFF